MHRESLPGIIRTEERLFSTKLHSRISFRALVVQGPNREDSKADGARFESSTYNRKVLTRALFCATLPCDSRSPASFCFLKSLHNFPAPSKVKLANPPRFHNDPFCLARNSFLLITIWIAYVSAEKCDRRTVPYPLTQVESVICVQAVHRCFR